MKKIIISILLLVTSFCLYAQNAETNEDNYYKFKTPSVIFTEGATFNQITRIEVLENRSNFVRETFLVGGYFNVSTSDLWLVDLELQLAAYYPLEVRFNGMTQQSMNMFNYAIDLFFGAKYTYEGFKYINFELSGGLHYTYQLTDEYYLNYLGFGTLDSIVFPISKGWSLVNSYFFSYDNANLGSNAKVQPYDASYQYHIELGVRYSKKVQNKYYYLGK